MSRARPGPRPRGEVPVLNLLFHSSEAIVGGSPYNRTQAELDSFCERLDRFLAYATRELRADAGDVQRVPRAILPATLTPLDAHPARDAAPAARPGGERTAAVAARRVAREASGDTVEYVSHPPRAGGRSTLSGPATWVPRRSDRWLTRAVKLGSVLQAHRSRQALEPAIARADVVHVHSNGLLPEVGALLAARARKPVVLTLYGTEIWHYRPRRFGPDLFTQRVPPRVGGDVLQRATPRARHRAGTGEAEHGRGVSAGVERRSSGTTRQRRQAGGPSLESTTVTSW